MYIKQHKDCDKSEAKSIKELFTYVIVQELDGGKVQQMVCNL